MNVTSVKQKQAKQRGMFLEEFEPCMEKVSEKTRGSLRTGSQVGYRAQEKRGERAELFALHPTCEHKPARLIKKTIFHSQNERFKLERNSTRLHSRDIRKTGYNVTVEARRDC